MSKMNLQKLRQICQINDRNYIEMNIPLPANDPLNRVVFKDDQGNNHTLQAISIHSYSAGRLAVAFNTEVFSDYKVGEAFLPRLKQILVEHGFHSGYLPLYKIYNVLDSKKVTYKTSYEFEKQIEHACYDDGRSMRAAVEFQAKLNKT